jgi:hypothetical protein
MTRLIFKLTASAVTVTAAMGTRQPGCARRIRRRFSAPHGPQQRVG